MVPVWRIKERWHRYWRDLIFFLGTARRLVVRSFHTYCYTLMDFIQYKQEFCKTPLMV